MAVLKNPRHEKYVQNLIAGMTQRKAYRDVFPSSIKWKDTTVDSKASELFSGKVLERYEELQEQQIKKALLKRWQKRKILAEIAEDEDNAPSDRMKAIDIDNKMEGEYTSKLEVSGIEEEKSKLDGILQQIRGDG